MYVYFFYSNTLYMYAYILYSYVYIYIFYSNALYIAMENISNFLMTNIHLIKSFSS